MKAIILLLVLVLIGCNETEQTYTTIGSSGIRIEQPLGKKNVTYSLAGFVPKGAKIDPKTGLFEWHPTHSQVGSWRFTVRVTDEHGAHGETTFRITVLARTKK